MAQQIAQQPTAPTGSHRLVARDVDVHFGPVHAVNNASINLDDGEFVALLGPSGCGKSTLLNVLAGLVEPDHGDIWLDGKLATNRLGKLAYMPQRDALLPWRTVIQNATLPAEITGQSVDEARRQAHALLPRFGLDGFADSYPNTLSGGMRQRAALLRTVLTQRDIMLLDEPFGALDALTRRVMQEWLLDLWDDIGSAILMVTHDVEEALLLADRVAVMTARPGRIKLIERVRLPRPRKAEMIADPALIEQKQQLLSALREEMPSMRGPQ